MENTNSCSQCNEPVSIIKHLYLGNDDTELLCDLCYTQCHGVAPSSDLMKISDNNNEELSNQVSCLEDLLSLDNSNVATTFSDSIQSIFRYSVKDISDIIDKFDTDIVMSIHKAAVQRFQQRFADYQHSGVFRFIISAFQKYDHDPAFKYPQPRLLIYSPTFV